MTSPAGAGAGAGAIRSWITASTLDAAADTLFLVGLGWAAAFAAGDLSAALILALGTIPRAVLMLVGGAFADQWGLALTANITLAVRAALMVPFALVLSSAGGPNGYLLGLISLLFGIADGLHVPALGGLVGLLAPGDSMRPAQARATTAALVAQVAAAPAAGFLVAREGGVLGWVACGLLVAAAIAMLGLRRRLTAVAPSTAELLESDPPGGERMGHKILDGLEYAIRRWSVLSLLLVFLLTNLAATAPIAVGIPLKAREYSWPGELYGIATLGFAVGSAAGILFMERRDPHPHRAMATAVGLIGGGAVGSGVLAIATEPLVACLGCLVMGALFAPAGVLLKTELLRVTPQTHLGRVSGLLGFAIYGGIPVGFAIYGWLASALSISAAGLIMTGALVAMLLALLPGVREPARH